MKPAFQKAIPLLTKIENAGFEAYFVGGSVRDSLLNKEIADVDIATSATPEEVKRIFPKTLDVGIEHGTIVVMFEGTPYEVTTFRTEAEYLDFRRPSEVKFIRSLKEDLQRRDFTMNAIAMDKEGSFIDPFNGMQSIKDKVIKTVGKAEERFEEDALRMMRAVRFYSQLAFDIETFTWDGLVSAGFLLEKIAVERKRAEFEKLLAGKNRGNALNTLAETGLYPYLPGMASFKEELLHAAKFECNELSVEEMWAFLMYHFSLNGKNAEFFLKSWKLPVKRIKNIVSVLNWISLRMNEEWTFSSMFQAGKQAVISTEKIYNVLIHNSRNVELSNLMKRYASLPIKHRSELQVTGNDLMEWFHSQPGPWIKTELEKAEMAVVNKEVDNRKESIREWLLKCKQS